MTNTQRIRHSTARKSIPSTTSSLSASTPSLLTAPNTQQPSGSTPSVATSAATSAALYAAYQLIQHPASCSTPALQQPSSISSTQYPAASAAPNTQQHQQHPIPRSVSSTHLPITP